MTEQEQVEIIKREGFEKVYVWNAEPNEEDPPHTHPFDTRLFILEGELQITVNKNIITLKLGKAIEIPRATLHSAVAGPKGCKYIVGERH